MLFIFLRHVLNTCIDPPHQGQVVAVEFQPGSSDIRRAMSAAADGKFKIWMLKQQRDVKGVDIDSTYHLHLGCYSYMLCVVELDFFRVVILHNIIQLVLCNH